MAVHQLRIFLVVMEKKVYFSRNLMFTAKKGNFVLTRIVVTKLLKLQFPNEQLFIVQNVRNNKVDPYNLPIYTI